MHNILKVSLFSLLPVCASVAIAEEPAVMDQAAVPAAVESAKIAGHSVGKVTLPSGYTLEQVRKAAIQAALAREWELVKDSPDQLIIHLEHRGYDSTITIVMEATNIELFSDSYKVKKNNRIPEDPEKWIKNLKKDIPAYLARM